MSVERCSWDPEDYARNSSAQQAWAEELIGKLSLSGTERVLDIGSGDGKVTALIAVRVPGGRVLGIDASGAMVEAARRRFPPDAFPNLRFLRMDAAAIDVDEPFDAAFSNATLHWVRDQAAVLRGVRRCLAPAGRLLFQMGGEGNARELVEALEGLIARDPWRRWFEGFEFPWSFLGPGEYRAHLEREGFRAVRCELLPREMACAGEEGLAAWIRTTWMPYTGRVPADRRAEFIARAVDRYCEARPPDAGGRVTVHMRRLEVEAVRA